MNYFNKQRRREERGELYGKLFAIGVTLFILLLLFSPLIIVGIDSTKKATVKDCKVLTLTEQQLISQNGTTIRYLVITDKETFVCKRSIINGKYDNSNIYWRLKKDSVYNFKVAGGGKSLLTDYRNILDYKISPK